MAAHLATIGVKMVVTRKKESARAGGGYLNDVESITVTPSFNIDANANVDNDNDTDSE